MKLEVIKLSKLKRSKKNVKRHEDVSKITKSIEGLGYRNPIIVREGTFEIVAGHGRLKALQEKGVEEAPVLIDKFTDEEADLYRIADNHIINPVEFDLLAEEIQRLDEMNLDIDIAGITEEEHERIMTWTPEVPEENEKIDEEKMKETSNECPKCKFKW